MTGCLQHELFATGAEVQMLNKQSLFYTWNKAEAAEPEYPCCIKLRSVSGNRMRPFQTIFFCVLLSSLMAAGQTKTKSYQLVFGIDTFKTTTFAKSDPFNNKSLREYSYLFKDGRQIIKIPRRIDTAFVRNMNFPTKGRTVIDTVDQIVVNKIVDTIDRPELDKIINSEIQIYSGTNKLKFDEAQFETVQSTGKSSYTIDLQKARVREGTHAFKQISSLDKGGYLILKTIWFYDLQNSRQDIECNVAWRIDE